MSSNKLQLYRIHVKACRQTYRWFQWSEWGSYASWTVSGSRYCPRTCSTSRRRTLQHLMVLSTVLGASSLRLVVVCAQYSHLWRFSRFSLSLSYRKSASLRLSAALAALVAHWATGTVAIRSFDPGARTPTIACPASALRIHVVERKPMSLIIDKWRCRPMPTKSSATCSMRTMLLCVMVEPQVSNRGRVV